MPLSVGLALALRVDEGLLLSESVPLTQPVAEAVMVADCEVDCARVAVRLPVTLLLGEEETDSEGVPDTHSVGLPVLQADCEVVEDSVGLSVPLAHAVRLADAEPLALGLAEALAVAACCAAGRTAASSRARRSSMALPVIIGVQRCSGEGRPWRRAAELCCPTPGFFCIYREFIFCKIH